MLHISSCMFHHLDFFGELYVAWSISQQPAIFIVFLNHNSTVCRMPNIWTTYHICIVDYMPTIYYYNSLYTPEFSIILLCPWGPNLLAMISLVSTHLNIWTNRPIWTQLGLITFSFRGSSYKVGLRRAVSRVSDQSWSRDHRPWQKNFHEFTSWVHWAPRWCLLVNKTITLPSSKLT